MQNKPTRFEQLKQLLADLEWTPGDDWRKYPCVDLSAEKAYCMVNGVGKSRPPYQWVYEFVYGSNLSLLRIKHHCENLRCFHPLHLYTKPRLGLAWLNIQLEDLKHTEDTSKTWNEVPCLEYPGAKDKPSTEYASVWALVDGKRKATSVHKYAFEYFHGKTSLEVCHRCDNPACFRAGSGQNSHLFAGTRDDNMKDAASKKRIRWGEGHPHTDITETQVREMRRRYASGDSIALIAKALGISINGVWRIVTRRRWAHLED